MPRSDEHESVLPYTVFFREENMAAFTVHSRRETLIFEQEEREVRVYRKSWIAMNILAGQRRQT